MERSTPRCGDVIALLVFAAFALAACAAPDTPKARCLFETRGGNAILCCPDETGKQRCLISHGGTEI